MKPMVCGRPQTGPLFRPALDCFRASLSLAEIAFIVTRLLDRPPSALADHGGQNRAAAHREDGNRMVLFTSLAPSIPTDPSLLGVAAGGVPWVLRSGEAELHGDGRLTVRIRGLLIASGQFAGTTGPVETVNASLYCGPSSNPVATSDTVPLSSDGDARITTTLPLPTKCQIPAVLVHPNGTLSAYITTSGFGG